MAHIKRDFAVASAYTAGRMVTLLHVSDLHFGRPHHPAARTALLRASQAIRPDITVVSGDLVQHAESNRAWRQARAFIDELPSPCLAVPGNHDIARFDFVTRLLAPFARYERYIHPERDRVLALGDTLLVGLATPRRWTFELGHVSRAQLDLARRAFEAAPPTALRVVVLHHGLLQRGWPSARRDHVRGSGRALRELDAMGSDLVLSGHNHHPYVARLGGGLLWSQAGTTTSRRFHFGDPRRNAFSLVRSTPDAIDIEWHLFEPALSEFVPTARHSFPRRPRPG